MVRICKHKGDAIERGNYLGVKLAEDRMEIFERMMDKRLRDIVENRTKERCSEMTMELEH